MHKDYNFLVIKPSIVSKVTAKLFPRVVVPFYIPISNVRGIQFFLQVLLAFGITATSYFSRPNRYTSLWY